MTYHPLRCLSVTVVAILLGACQTMSPDHNSQSANFDQQFLDQMSQHHAGAIAMAQVALQKGSTDHVKTMATTLVTKEQAEVQQLQGWRTAWYGPGPTPAPRDMDRHMIDEISRAQGIAFDKAYVTKMIEHHQEGIAMATPATHHAVHAEVKAFAQQMIDDQTHEIEHLKEHLKEWSGAL